MVVLPTMSSACVGLALLSPILPSAFTVNSGVVYAPLDPAITENA